MATTHPVVRLQAADGTNLGYVYVNAESELVLREAPGGSEAVLGADGTLGVDAVEAGSYRNVVGEAGIQTAWDGLVVPVGPGVTMSDAVDPAATTTPVQDAIDRIDGPGAVLLPPTVVEEAETIVGLEERISLLGWGTQASVIRFTDPSVDGARFPSNDVSGWVYIDGVGFDGMGGPERAGSGTAAFRWTSSFRRFDMGRVRFRGWEDVFVFDGGAPYDSAWQSVDCGYQANAGRVIAEGSSHASGPPLTIGSLSAGNGNTAAIPLDFRGLGVPVVIDTVNIGGGAPGIATSGPASVSIRRVNYEPAKDPGGGTAVRIDGAAPCRFGTIRNVNATLDSVVQLGGGAGAARKVIGFVGSGGSVGTNLVEVVSDTQAHGCRYEGPASDVTNSTGGPLTGPIHCWDGSVT